MLKFYKYYILENTLQILKDTTFIKIYSSINIGNGGGGTLFLNHIITQHS